MSDKALKSQRTQMYVAFQTGATAFTMITLQDVSAIPNIGNPVKAKLDATDLDSVAKEYVAGLSDAAEMSLSYMLRGSVNQQRLRDLDASGVISRFMICYSENTAQPTMSPTTGVFTPALGRSHSTFSAYVSSMAFSVAVDAVIQGTIGLQVSGSVSTTIVAEA